MFRLFAITTRKVKCRGILSWMVLSHKGQTGLKVWFIPRLWLDLFWGSNGQGGIHTWKIDISFFSFLNFPPFLVHKNTNAKMQKCKKSACTSATLKFVDSSKHAKHCRGFFSRKVWKDLLKRHFSLWKLLRVSPPLGKFYLVLCILIYPL